MKEMLAHNLTELNQLARQFLEKRIVGDNAVVVGLSGDLGVGKTAFVKEIGNVLGIKEDITSPTFVIQKNYPINWNGFTTLVHIDAYRLENGEEMKPLKFGETLKTKENLICIEWPEHIESVLPENIIRIRFEVVEEGVRNIIFYGTETI